MDEITRQAVTRDIRLLQRVFSPQNVWWPPSLAWVRLNSYRLPSFYNRTSTDLLIIVPPHYGLVNMPIEEFYLSKGLLLKTKRGWEDIPHYHDYGLNKYNKKGGRYDVSDDGLFKNNGVYDVLKVWDDPLDSVCSFDDCPKA